MQKINITPNADKFEYLHKNEKRELIHIHLDAGQEIPQHTAKFLATVIPIKGKIIFSVPEKDYEITAGDLILLNSDDPHWLKAVEDSDLIVIKHL